MVKIQDHLPPLTSWSWTWEKKMIHPSSLEDRSSTLLTQSFTSDLDKSTSNSLEKRYDVILIVILLVSSRRRTAPGGDVDHPVVKRIIPDGINGKIKRLKNL
jgi:hypothetical protein